MSFLRYPKYKDSGVEWLGEVPEYWKVMRVKHLTRSIEQGWSPQCEGFPVETENEWGVLKVGCVNGGTFNPAENKVLPPDLEPIPALGIRSGDLLVSRANTRELVGSAAVAAMDYPKLLLCDKLYRLRLKPELASPNFVSHYLGSNGARGQIELGATGASASMVNIGQSIILELMIVVPSREEQNSIAIALERELSKIDELVTEQHRLIELLKEKRQAVISHAVTKGLNPHAPMKPSGIEWLGDVPEHWEVLKGSLIGTLFGSEQVPEESIRDEGDLPFIKVGSLSPDSFGIESWDWFVDRAVADQYEPRSGFIVFPKRGAAIFTNKVNIVDRPSLIDPNLMGWAIGNRANTSFVAYVLKSRKLDELADVSTVPQINNKHIAPERFPVPPLDEQRRIVAHLDAKIAKLDTLTAEAQRAIDLLQERCTALISAAVTGQIDVRSFAERQPA